MYTPLYRSLLSLAPTTLGAQKVHFLYMSYHRREIDDITPADALGAGVPTVNRGSTAWNTPPTQPSLSSLPLS